MRAPPFLAACALALWGISFGHWLIASLLALLIETSHWTHSKIPIEPAGFRNLGLLARVGFVITLGWHVIALPLPQAMLATLSWTPAIFALIVVPQLFSITGTAPLTVLRTFRAHDAQSARVDLSYPYVGMTLLAAGGAPARFPGFYLALALLVAWALIGAGRTTTRWLRVLPLLAVAVALGYGLHVGLRTMQTQVESGAGALLGIWLPQHNPSDRSRTRIGDLGRVKLSDRVLMRISVEGAMDAPLLLSDAAFSRFDRGTWTNRGVEDRRVVAGATLGKFPLLPSRPNNDLLSPSPLTSSARGIIVSTHTRDRGTPLVLPLDATQIDGLAATAVIVNGRGAARAEGVPGFVQYRVSVARTEMSIADPPHIDDLEIPIGLLESVQRVAVEAGLDGLSEWAALRALRGLFREKFRYSLFLGDRMTGARTLGQFLTDERSGHCEYFAAATVMMLRAAGIPARYVTGFAMEEWSEIERKFLVRARHGHAWAVAWLGGRWVEVDTTPPEWGATEEQALASLVRPLRDIGGWLLAQIEAWRLHGNPFPKSLIAILGVFAVIAWARGMRGRGPRWPWPWRRQATNGSGGATDPQRAALAPIEAQFAASGFARRAGQSPQAWARGLREAGLVDSNRAHELQALIALHYRARFAERPGTAIRAALTAALAQWQGKGR
ncbi:MAG: transglutaminase-like domain-containing protein [Burkholderiales bacterium]